MHTQNLRVRKDMFVQSPWIRHDLSNIFANIGHISQCKALIPIADDAVVDIDTVVVVGPPGWDFWDEDLIPAAYVDDSVGKSSAVNGAEDVEFLLIISQLVILRAF